MDIFRYHAWFKCRMHLDFIRLADVSLIAFGVAIDPLEHERDLARMSFDDLRALSLQRRAATVHGDDNESEGNGARRRAGGGSGAAREHGEAVGGGSAAREHGGAAGGGPRGSDDDDADDEADDEDAPSRPREWFLVHPRVLKRRICAGVERTGLDLGDEGAWSDEEEDYEYPPSKYPATTFLPGHDRPQRQPRRNEAYELDDFWSPGGHAENELHQPRDSTRSMHDLERITNCASTRAVQHESYDRHYRARRAGVMQRRRDAAAAAEAAEAAEEERRQREHAQLTPGGGGGGGGGGGARRTDAGGGYGSSDARQLHEEHPQRAATHLLRPVSRRETSSRLSRDEHQRVNQRLMRESRERGHDATLTTPRRSIHAGGGGVNKDATPPGAINNLATASLFDDFALPGGDHLSFVPDLSPPHQSVEDWIVHVTTEES